MTRKVIESYKRLYQNGKLELSAFIAMLNANVISMAEFEEITAT